MATPYVAYDGPIVTREAARAEGLMRYFTAEPCVHGHLSKRHVTNGRCMTCLYLMRKPRTDKARETLRIWCAKDRSANPEKRRAYKREYYHRNKARVQAQNEASRKKNPEPRRCTTRNYKARKRQAEGMHTAADVAAILKAQRGMCAYCRKKVGNKFDIDHIKPLSDGGTNHRANLQITCGTCNRSKGAADPISFAQRFGLLL